MFNNIHFLLVVVVLIFLKITVFTNKPRKTIIIRMFLYSGVIAILLIFLLTTSHDLSNLIEYDENQEITKIDINPSGGRREIAFIEEEIEAFLQEYINTYEITYTLKAPIQTLYSESGLISIYFWTNKGGQKITITGDNNLYLYNDVIRVYKVYKVHNGDLYNALSNLIEYKK